MIDGTVADIKALKEKEVTRQLTKVRRDRALSGGFKPKSDASLVGVLWENGYLTQSYRDWVEREKKTRTSKKQGRSYSGLAALVSNVHPKLGLAVSLIQAGQEGNPNAVLNEINARQNSPFERKLFQQAIIAHFEKMYAATQKK